MLRRLSAATGTDKAEHINEAASLCEHAESSALHCRAGKLALPPAWIADVRALLQAEFVAVSAGQLFSSGERGDIVAHDEATRLPTKFARRIGEYVRVYTEAVWLRGSGSTA